MSVEFGMMRGNAARASGACACRAPLREIWKVDIAEHRFLHHPPVYFSGGLLVFVGRKREEHLLMAIDARTREGAWTYPWAATPRLVHRGLVFAWPNDDEAHLIDVRSGRPDRALACPRTDDVIAIDRFLAAHGEDHEYGGHRVWVTDWTTGRRLWLDRLRASVSVAGYLCASKDRLYYGLSDGSIVARRLETGSEIWKREFPELATDCLGKRAPAALADIPCLHDTLLVVAIGGRLMGLRQEDGATAWRADAPGLSSGYLHADRYYTIDGRSRYRSFDASTGELLADWDLLARRPKTVRSGACGTMAVSDTHLFVYSNDGALLAFDRETAEFSSQHQPKPLSTTTGPVVVVDGMLYYDNSCVLYCLAPAG